MANPVSFQNIARLKSKDYPSGLGTEGAVGKLFQQLGPLTSRFEEVSNNSKFRQERSFVLQTPASDWQALVPEHGWVLGTEPAMTTQVGSLVALAYRIDDAGNAWLFGSLDSTGAGGNVVVLSAGALPTPIRPNVTFEAAVPGTQAALIATGRLKVYSTGQLDLQVLPVVAATVYSFKVAWPCPSRVPGFMGTTAQPLAAGARNGSPGFPVVVQFDRSEKPASVRLSLVESVKGSAVWALNTQAPHVATGLCWSWRGSGKVQVDAIPGLALGTAYNVTIEALYA